MKIKGLRKKISFVILIPLTIAVVLTAVAQFIYLKLEYPNIMNNYADKMISNQKYNLLKVSSYLSKAASYSNVQKVFNFVNVCGDVLDQYLFYGLDVNYNLDTDNIYINSKEYYKKKINNTDLSLWTLSNETDTTMFSNSSLDNLNTSSIINPLLKAVSKIGSFTDNDDSDINSEDNFFTQIYLSYSSDGLFYVNPPTEDNYTTCPDIKNQCSYCSEYPNTSYYDPRCRNFYNDTLIEETAQAILVTPYIFLSGMLGQSVCRGQWNFTSSDMISVLCADFYTKDVFQSDLVRSINEGPTYTYALSTTKTVMSYKMRKVDLDDDILTLEFGSSTSDDAKKFSKNILPLFTNQVSEVKYYMKNGDKMMAAVTPIEMMIDSSNDFQHLLSVAVVMKKSHVESKINDLKTSCMSLLTIALYFQIAMMVPIIIFLMLLTDTITKSIILPIDRLMTILKKMKEGDLAIDIMATYEQSPLEVTRLYEVFDKMRVVLRFSSISPDNMTQAFLVYSQALNLFIQFGNERGMEICNREIGYICFKQKQWENAAHYLQTSLELAIRVEIYSDIDIAKRKTETAKAYIKAGTNKRYAMNLFGEALDTFSKQRDSTRIVVCLIEVAETLQETKELPLALLDFIEKNFENCDIEERNVINQRFLLIKASFLRSRRKFKEATILLSNIIDTYSEFIPEIWTNAINLLIEIFKDNGLDWSALAPLRSLRRYSRKDIVLVISDSICKNSISMYVHDFLRSMLEPNDRLSLLQFGSSFKVMFNLTKLPLKILSLGTESLVKNNQRVLYDCLQEGLRQLRVNSILRRDSLECKECIIVITDCTDNASKSTFRDFISEFEKLDIEIILVNCFLEERVFDGLRLATEKCSIFHIKFEKQAKYVFKELEAYLCPYKEVFCEERIRDSNIN